MEQQESATFSLRPATEDDLPALVALEQAIQVAPWNAEHFRAELQKPFSQVLVLTDDETDSVLIGYAVFWRVGDEVHLLNVGVALEHRGQGFGKLLVRRVLAFASRENAKKIWLEVRKSNLAAVGLYQGLGFAICQIRKQFYSNGEDAYVLEHRVDGNTSDF